MAKNEVVKLTGADDLLDFLAEFFKRDDCPVSVELTDGDFMELTQLTVVRGKDHSVTIMLEAK